MSCYEWACTDQPYRAQGRFHFLKLNPSRCTYPSSRRDHLHVLVAAAMVVAHPSVSEERARQQPANHNLLQIFSVTFLNYQATWWIATSWAAHRAALISLTQSAPRLGSLLGCANSAGQICNKKVAAPLQRSVLERRPTVLPTSWSVDLLLLVSSSAATTNNKVTASVHLAAHKARADLSGLLQTCSPARILLSWAWYSTMAHPHTLGSCQRLSPTVGLASVGPGHGGMGIRKVCDMGFRSECDPWDPDFPSPYAWRYCHKGLWWGITATTTRPPAGEVLVEKVVSGPASADTRRHRHTCNMM